MNLVNHDMFPAILQFWEVCLVIPLVHREVTEVITGHEGGLTGPRDVSLVLKERPLSIFLITVTNHTL